MSTKLYALIFIVFFPFFVKAQNWQTVRSNDTVYFLADASAVFGDNDSNYLRAIYTDSATVSGADSIFFFYRGARSEGINMCIDTLGVSWMGMKMIHHANGIENYFNSRSDTITVLTGAMPGDTWLIAKDSAGNIFRATMQQATVMTVDSVQDSIKIFSIQAYSGTVPVNSIYNGDVLMFSKNHGWIHTLDWYDFPNVLPFNNVTIGLRNKAGVHHRQDKSFADIDLEHEDVIWKYAPGNEWISDDELEWYVSPNNHKIIIHDSVISSQVNGNQLSVQLKSEYFKRKLVYVYTPSGVTTHLEDTTFTTYGTYNFSLSVSAAQYTVRQLKKECKNYFFPLSASRWDSLRYYNIVNRFCGKRVFNFMQTGERLSKDTCYRMTLSVSGGRVSDYTVMQGFGQIFLYEMQSNGSGLDYAKSLSYPYMKIGSCISGTKFDVLALGVESLPGKSAPLVEIYPNPATDKIFVSCKYEPVLEILVYDLQGRKIIAQSATGNFTQIQTDHLLPGIYVVRVIAKSGVFSKQILRK